MHDPAVPTGPDTTPPAWSVGLNPQQRAAVVHDDGPLLVVAGAGTGKTRTLISRLARLIRTGTPPERILLVTFSRRAAAEMVRRAGALTTPGAARAVHAGTFHAVAHRLLHSYAGALGLSAGFSVVDQADATQLMGLARPIVPAGRRRRFPPPATLSSIYSRVINSGVVLDEVLARWYPWCLAERDSVAECFDAYTRRKRAHDLLDFDDLLVYWRAATADAVVGPVMAGLYDHVLVDEYQDTNAIQADILRALCARTRNISAVGDDAQAIYSFRAATTENMVHFADHFATSDPAQPSPARVTLEENYRSTQPILDLANAVMRDTGFFAKMLWSAQPGGGRPVLATCTDEATQADAVCETVLEHFEAGMALRDQAVLFRAGHHSDALEVELGRRNIPFVKYGGLRFLEAAHVRDLLCLLRLLDNPYDELAWSRTLLLIDGIGPASAARVMDQLDVYRRRPAGSGDPLTRFIDPLRPHPPRANQDETAAIAAALDDCRGDGRSPGEQVDRLIEALGPIVARRYDRADARLADLAALGRLAAVTPTRTQFVADMTLDPAAATGDYAGPPQRDDDFLTLSTVHSAKGGEWQAVHVIHAADGHFPSDMATADPAGIAEERRLFYVALTRPRRHLHIYTPLRYHYDGPAGRGDRHGYAVRTRFLPPALDRLLDHRAVRSPDADSDLPAGTPAGAVNLAATVDAALEHLW